MSTISIIKVDSLTKSFYQAKKNPGLSGAIKHLINAEYVEKLAVNNISFEINEGESVAYLGRNGAGKSTTIKMLSGILVPTSGHVWVDGIEPYKKRIINARKIGAVFGQRTQLWWDIPLCESYKLIKDIYDIPKSKFENNMEMFCKLLNIDEFLYLTPRKLSLGQRMRADIVAALLHDPRIIYLDEPTIGLDISAKEKIRDFIRYINKVNKTTVVLTTHDLGDIEKVSDRLILIENGQIIYDGDLKVVKDTYLKTRTIHLYVSEVPQNISRLLNEVQGFNLVDHKKDRISISFDRFKFAAGDVINHLAGHMNLLDITIDEPNIDTVIKDMYEGNLAISSRA